jgi:hypothetical protein
MEPAHDRRKTDNRSNPRAPPVPNAHQAEKAAIDVHGVTGTSVYPAEMKLAPDVGAANKARSSAAAREASCVRWNGASPLALSATEMQLGLALRLPVSSRLRRAARRYFADEAARGDRATTVRWRGRGG